MNLSPLNDFHTSNGAKLVEFAGWNMPLYYSGINEEHLHTRSQASIFDVSHMGRIHLEGADSESLLQYVCTRDLSATEPGQSKYSHICKHDGGILDDVIVSRHSDHWVVVCNASNREKIVAWLNRQAQGRSVQITDLTLETAMIAIQGPGAIDLVEARFGLELRDLKRYRFKSGEFLDMHYTIYRSGYTGEDGIEAIIPATAVNLLMPRLFGGESSDDNILKPAGLGARDTLRLEAAMPLYGHELNEDVDSISAGQGWCVQLDLDFIGADAMRKVQSEGPKRALVGLELEGRRVARQGYEILQDINPVGFITSGTWSPTLQKSIAMGFVDRACTESETDLSVNLGRKKNPATVVPLPFYKRPK